MRKKGSRALLICVVFIMTICICFSSNAHSGRTDSSGGHKDNKNKSGLGSYHYHCGGHPPHLHTNGVCPYSSTSTKKSSSSSKSNSSGSSSTKDTKSNSKSNTSSSTSKSNTTSKNIQPTSIQINENVEELKIGDSKRLTGTITPSDSTSKTITWESSDDSIATVSTNGEIKAKKEGTVTITAKTLNGKTDSVRITIKEDKNNNNVVKVSTSTITSNSNVYTNNNSITNSSEDLNAVGGVAALVVFGGGAYYAYSRYKKSNKK